jgi:hypothetical protein
MCLAALCTWFDFLQCSCLLLASLHAVSCLNFWVSNQPSTSQKVRPELGVFRVNTASTLLVDLLLFHSRDREACCPCSEQQASTLIRHMKDDIVPMLQNLPIVLGLISLLVNNFAVPLMGIVLQYMSVRFKWEYSDVGLSTLVRAFI